MANYMMTISIQDQLQAFIQGFYDIIPFKAIKHLTPIELGSLFVGKQDINVKELKESTSYSTYTSDSMHIKWLWEIVESWDQELRKKFLFFITG